MKESQESNSAEENKKNKEQKEKINKEEKESYEMLDIDGKKIDWNKHFVAIREICAGLITEDYVKSQFMSTGFYDYKIPDYERPLNEQPDVVAHLIGLFRKLFEYQLKAKYASREYGRLYVRVAQEIDNVLKIFGVHALSMYDKKFDEVVNKIVEKCG